MILTTDRLLLRYQRYDDVDALVDIWSDPEVTKYMGGPRDKDFLHGEFKKNAKDPRAEKYDLWIVVEKESDEVIGHCGFLDKKIEGSLEIEINYIFNPKAWGFGYGVEIASALLSYGFNELGINRLIALIHPENIASAKVAEKIGMKYEQQVPRPDNKFRDMYAIEKDR